MAKPFLLLTFRRTGGSALSVFLRHISPYESAGDEPFNYRREFGHISVLLTKKNMAEEHREEARRNIRDITLKQLNIKHCVETVPEAVTVLLIEEAVRSSYGIVLLTRRNEKERLFSLCVAQALNVWGKEQSRAFFDQLGEDFKKPAVDIEALRQRIALDAAMARRLKTLLQERHIDYKGVFFESLYRGREAGIEKALELADYLGLPITEKTSFRQFESVQKQKTEQLAAYIKNIDDVHKELDTAFGSAAFFEKG